MKRQANNSYPELVEKLQEQKDKCTNMYIKYLYTVMQLELSCDLKGHKHYTYENKRNLMTAYSHVSGDEDAVFYTAAMLIGKKMDIYPAGLFGQICKDKFKDCTIQGMHDRPDVDVKIAILSFQQLDCPVQFVDRIYNFCANDSEYKKAA